MKLDNYLMHDAFLREDWALAVRLLCEHFAIPLVQPFVQPTRIWRGLAYNKDIVVSCGRASYRWVEFDGFLSVKQSVGPAINIWTRHEAEPI